MVKEQTCGHWKGRLWDRTSQFVANNCFADLAFYQMVNPTNGGNIPSNFCDRGVTNSVICISFKTYLTTSVTCINETRLHSL